MEVGFSVPLIAWLVGSLPGLVILAVAVVEHWLPLLRVALLVVGVSVAAGAITRMLLLQAAHVMYGYARISVGLRVALALVLVYLAAKVHF